MNVAAVKLACWLSSITITFGLSGYVYDFYRRQGKLSVREDESYVREVLGKGDVIQQGEVDRLSRDHVQRVMEKLNWTGAPPPEVVQANTSKVDETPILEPVDRILSLAMIQVSRWSPAESSIHVRLARPPAGMAAELQLFTGESLPPPHEYIHVKEIRVDGVDFAFADEARPVETISTSGEDLPLIVYVGEEGPRMQSESPDFPLTTSNYSAPHQTYLRRKDYYVIGTDDAAYLEQNYAQVLTNDVRYTTYKDPATGKRSGIQILEVTPGSIAERHGAHSGDVILSINGHAVTSDQDALHFIRTNKDKYSVWEVEVLRYGRVTTMRFESSDK